MKPSQKDWFSETDNGSTPAPTSSKLVFRIKGITPSFKTQKTAYGWKDKKSGKIFARPATLPEHKKWMQDCVADLRSQLFSAFQIDEFTILTDAIRRSLIASLPYDDKWTDVPSTVLESLLCPDEEASAEIIIERLP